MDFLLSAAVRNKLSENKKIMVEFFLGKSGSSGDAVMMV